MNASRSRPLAAFWLLTIAVAVVMAQGLREDAARVLISAGVPTPVANVLAADMVLGEQLQQVPAQAVRESRTETRSVAEVRVSTGPATADSGTAAKPKQRSQPSSLAGQPRGAQAAPTQSVEAKPRAQSAQSSQVSHGGGHKGHTRKHTSRHLWKTFLQRFEQRHQASLKHHAGHGHAHAKKHHTKRHHAKKHHAKKHHAKKHHATRHHRR